MEESYSDLLATCLQFLSSGAPSGYKTRQWSVAWHLPLFFLIKGVLLSYGRHILMSQSVSKSPDEVMEWANNNSCEVGAGPQSESAGNHFTTCITLRRSTTRGGAKQAVSSISGYVSSIRDAKTEGVVPPWKSRPRSEQRFNWRRFHTCRFGSVQTVKVWKLGPNDGGVKAPWNFAWNKNFKRLA